jgi:hypothetical protein
VRTLLVFGPQDDPRREQQLLAVEAEPRAAAERELLLVDVAARPDAPALRDHYDVSEPFAVLLIGHDGMERERWPQPVSAAELWAVVDASPMRRAEALGEFDVDESW